MSKSLKKKMKKDDVIFVDGERVPNPHAVMQLALMKLIYESPDDLLEFIYPAMNSAIELADDGSNNFLASLYKVKEVTPRKSQLIRERCRTIAAILWEQNLHYQIKDIVDHEWMEKHSGGYAYGKRTIHGWIADLDPRPAEEKQTPFKKKSTATVSA